MKWIIKTTAVFHRWEITLRISVPLTPCLYNYLLVYFPRGLQQVTIMVNTSVIIALCTLLVNTLSKIPILDDDR